MQCVVCIAGLHVLSTPWIVSKVSMLDIYLCGDLFNEGREESVLILTMALAIKFKTKDHNLQISSLAFGKARKKYMRRVG